MEKWLVLYKKNELKERSYDRLEDTFKNYIMDSDLGHTTEDCITPDMIQNHIVTLKRRDVWCS